MINIIQMEYKEKLIRLGKLFRSQRNLLKLTVRQVASNTPLDKNTVSRIERGLPCRSDSISIYSCFLDSEINNLKQKQNGSKTKRI
jgi:hypothetical protein